MHNLLRLQGLPRQIYASFAFLIAAVLVLAACGRTGEESASDTTADADQSAYGYESEDAVQPADQGPIKLAIMAPVTGDGASIGAEQVNFARLAVEYFNQTSGMNIELVESDTELDPSKATTEAQRLMEDDDIYAVVGPAGSQVVAAVAPLLEPASLAMISPSATSPDLTEQGYKHLFRVVPRDDVQGPSDANFIIDELGAETVWIIDDQSSYSTGLADEAEKIFTERGIASTRESVSQETTDFSSLVTRIKADEPDVIFIPMQLASQAALFARQMAEQGVAATLVGGDGLFFVEDFIESAAGGAEGAYVSFFAPDVTTVESARSIVEAYTAQYGEVGPFGAPAYAATMVALEAIQRAYDNGELSREAVLEEVARTDQSDSIMGIPIRFDAKGDIENAAFFIFRVEDGAFVPVS